MKWSIIGCAVGGILLPAIARATTPYYVFASGAANTQSGDPLAEAQDAHSFNTGNLVQAQAGGSQVASVQAPYNEGAFIALTTATGSATSTAQIGALHGYVNATSDTGLFNTPYPVQNPGNAESRSTAQATWSDTIHFRTFNPNGSDFVWLLDR